jgi:hypothetical protein
VATGRIHQHAAVQLLPVVVCGSRNLQFPAVVDNGLALVEELLSGAEPADDLS